MAQLSESERQQISQAVAEAMEERPVAVGADAAAAPAIPNPIPFFCEHWPTVKAVLQFLLPFLPDRIREAARKLIDIGEKIHSRICG